MHPFGQLVFFGCMILTGISIASGAGLMTLSLLMGQSFHEAIQVMNHPDTSLGKSYNLALNAFNQLFAFFAMAWAARFLFQRQTLVSWRLPDSWKWWVIGAAFAWAAQPIIDLTYRLNRALIVFLPEALASSANHYEATAESVTQALLTFEASWQFPATLLTVAVLPALCEEFAFRGVAQPLFARWTGSIHAGIWLSAVVFSAIHLQFHGFIPRMILGAGLGYLVAYSGSLWPAIAAHGFNNASTVILAAIEGRQWVEEEMTSTHAWEMTDYVAAGISAFVFVWGIRWMQTRASFPTSHPLEGEKSNN